MNRKIKFRAWNGETMNYHIVAGTFGAFWVNPGSKNNGLDEKDSASLTPFNTKCLDTTEIMQFTGLKDGNGSDIYEGDILKISTEKAMIVGWSEKFAAFVLNSEGWTFSHWFGGNYIPEDCVVIGNKYENPDILLDK